ncbi:MAG: proline--tRNA ligase [Planctomycetes bacterium]|nr:proline--tRNA ligase [Planctomycetota bacterium]
MKWSQAFIPTLKEDPSDAETISHKLMVRAGLVRKLAAGTYTYLPLGQKVLNKVINIVREEIDRAGAQELLMPAIHPVELWEKTGRLALFGDIIYKVKDRTDKISVLGPTHEEIVTDLVANEIRSYRQLPVTLYQIQTKFRDEMRPRFGIIRSKEFLMMDAYSFDTTKEGLDKSYQAMYDAYCRIFDRCGVKYSIVEAESGLMGGNVSHEFMTPSAMGEDLFVTCPKCNYGANIVLAPANMKITKDATITLKPMSEILTPGKTSIEAISEFLKAKPEMMLKTLICMANGKPIAVLLRGDHELNVYKLSQLVGTNNISMADVETIQKVTGGPMGFSGPVGLKGIEIIADNAVLGMRNFVAGANKFDTHLVNVNLTRDFTFSKAADIRVVAEGDLCPKCGEKLTISHGIEIGHVFKLGTRYSEALSASFLDEKGNLLPDIMGCYGIGVNRIIASFIENSYDENGIIWSNEIAPYDVVISSINPEKEEIARISQMLYTKLAAKGVDVLWDDRDLSAGIKFKDADLIGIPIRVTVGKYAIEKQTVDIKLRKELKQKAVPVADAVNETMQLLSPME